MNRILLKYALVISIIIQPFFLFASSQNEPPQTSHELSSEIYKNTKEWSTEKEKVVPDLIAAAERLAQKAEEIQLIKGNEYFQGLLEGNQFIIYDEILKTELTYRLIDQVRVPRIVIGDEAYLIIDEGQLSRESKHLSQYVSRLMFEAKQKGVHVNLVVLSQGQVKIERLKKPTPTNWRWWREYFVSKYKNPTASDFTLAAFNGILLQGALTMTMTWLKYKLHGTEISTIPTLWTMAYSTLYGTFLSSIRNWTVYSGTRLTRILKSQTLSTLYAYGLVMAVSDGDFSDRVAMVSVFTYQGLAMNVSILANGLMNNFVKDYWNQIPRLRDQTRVNAGQLTFKSEWANKLFGWKKSSVEGQLLYLIPWSINVLSLMTMATTSWLHIPGTSISIPLFQMASIPIAMYWSKVYARKLANNAKSAAERDETTRIWANEIESTANQYQNAWDKSFGLDVKLLPNQVFLGLKSVNLKTREVASKCLALLSSRLKK